MRPNEQITLAHAFQKRMMDKFPKKDDGWKKRELAKHKNIKQKKMLIQLTSYYVKFLNDGFPKVDVENICDIHL